MPDTPIRILNPQYGGAFETSSGAALPFVLPGEELAPNARPESPSILRPSPERITPGCPHFGPCGGCQYQHAAYPAQLELKRQILTDLLTAAGLTNLPETRTHAGSDWQYRNRIRLRIEPTSDGFRAGYSRRASNDFLPITTCPIAAPLLWRAAETFLSLAPQAWLAAASELELFTTPDESALQLRLLLRDPAPARDPAAFAALCDRLRAELPQLLGGSAELDPELNRRIRRRWSGALWGAPGLSYPAAGRNYWVSRGAFFQVNRFLIDTLVDLVTAHHSGALACDLFAGAGLFSRPLAAAFRRLIAVEAGDAAAADLASASRAKAGPAFEAVQATTLDFLRAHVIERERPDFVVLDPPRAGLGPVASELLTRIAAPRVVYVSCDPETLARDLRILTRETYHVETLDLIDLFPQTYHMETVVHLTRR